MTRPGILARLRQTRARFREVGRDWGPESALRPRSPKVSVMVITYNHERYIGQALDGILLQERDFDIEINVIDDASTDGTQRIVLDYQRRHPELIRCFFAGANLGHIATQLNTYRGFQTLRGQYFALLEGDDYWTDPAKLRTQVAFLDANPRYVACAHDTMKVYEDGSRPAEHFLPSRAFGRPVATIRDLIGLAGVFHLSSLVYRNVFETVPPLCFADPYSCEATVNMVYGQYGDIRHLPGCMSVYRAHGTGVFSGQGIERLWRFHLHGFRRFALYMGHRHLYLFAAAVSGFAAYALGAHRRGEVPLHWRTRAMFSAHLAIAKPLFMLLHALRLLRQAAGHGRVLRQRLAGRPLPPDYEYPWLPLRLIDTWAVFRRTRRALGATAGRRSSRDGTLEPRVSVVVLTRDHARNVARALSSILEQERGFEIEVNVVDNASTDGTRQIVLEHQRRHPGLIRAFFLPQGEQQASWQVHIHRALRTARGTYLAVLDGSDCWPDRGMLAEQIAVLDAYPEFVGCGREVARSPAGDSGAAFTAGLDDLIEQSVVLPLGSVVYRNLFEGTPPPCFADPYSSEAAMHAAYVQFGPVRVIRPGVGCCATVASTAVDPGAQARMWTYQLRGFERLALYLGTRHARSVARALLGFCRHVRQSASASGIALPRRARWRFSAYLVVLGAMDRVLRESSRIAQLRGGVDSSLRAARARTSAPTLRGRTYRLLVLLSPHWLLRAVLALEKRWPRLHVMRRSWKQTGGIQTH